MYKERLTHWLATVPPLIPDMDALVLQLVQYNARVVSLRREKVFGELPYRATFRFFNPKAVIYIRFCLQDWQSDSEVVITNMTARPKGKGFGSQALQRLLQWAHDNNFQTVEVVQVNSKSESFWQKNGFEKYPEPNKCNDFVYICRPT